MDIAYPSLLLILELRDGPMHGIYHVYDMKALSVADTPTTSLLSALSIFHAIPNVKSTGPETSSVQEVCQSRP